MTSVASQDLVTRFTRVIPRADGSEVKIVAQAYFGEGLRRSVGVDVFRRNSSADAWHLCSDRPHPDWKKMSRQDYIEKGRCEKYQVATHGEILGTAAMIGKPISELPPGTLLQ